jgi:hypothetical protein
VSKYFKHPILRNLPQEIKNEPSVQKIQQWLDAKRKKFTLIKYVSIILFLLSVIFYFIYNDVLTGLRGLDILNNISDLAMPFVFLILSFLFQSLIKKHEISDEEIKRLISEYSD